MRADSVGGVSTARCIHSGKPLASAVARSAQILTDKVKRF